MYPSVAAVLDAHAGGLASLGGAGWRIRPGLNDVQTDSMGQVTHSGEVDVLFRVLLVGYRPGPGYAAFRLPEGISPQRGATVQGRKACRPPGRQRL